METTALYIFAIVTGAVFIGLIVEEIVKVIKEGDDSDKR